MNLTSTMQAALAYAKEHGGNLCRYPGGFWARWDWDQVGRPGPWFGTPTVEGLVKRGAMEYVGWQQGRSGVFPITARVKV